MAVLNVHGEQNTRDGKIQKYYLVEDDHTFTDEMNVTNAENLFLFDDLGRFADYKEFRASLQLWGAGQTFSELSLEDRVRLAKNFAVVMSDVITVFPTLEERLIHGRVWHSRSVAARSFRKEAIETEINALLVASDRQDLIDTTGLTELLSKYVAMGREGVSSDGEGFNGLLDFLESTNGYVGIGFLDKSYTLAEGETRAALSARAARIIRKGRRLALSQGSL